LRVLLSIGSLVESCR